MTYPSAKGFTLIELVVVITLIGIMSAYVAIKEASTTPFDLDVEANKLLTDVRLARTLSMSFNQNYRFVVTSANTYQIKDASNTAYYNPAAESVTSNISSSFTLSPTTTIAFNGLGQSMNASNVLNASAVTLTLSDGSHTRSITIEPQTGFIHE